MDNVPDPVFTENEVEFVAEETMITILPAFSEKVLHFIDGDYGPFRAQYPSVVPLWLAVELKKFKKCQIRAPEWMDIDALEAQKREEQNDEKFFRPIPYHYIEISNILLKHASDDIPNAERIRTLIADIIDVRACKIRSGLQNIESGINSAIKLNNISAMELNSIRTFTLKALNDFQTLSRAVPAPDELRRFSQPQDSRRSSMGPGAGSAAAPLRRYSSNGAVSSFSTPQRSSNSSSRPPQSFGSSSSSSSGGNSYSSQQSQADSQPEGAENSQEPGLRPPKQLRRFHKS